MNRRGKRRGGNQQGKQAKHGQILLPLGRALAAFRI